MTIFNVFTLMGGIAMFLYGMDLMGKALEQTAGSKLQGILSTMTSSPIRALLLGVAVTAVIQSSGATTVMAVGFVNSGLMELHQAIGVIMGANIGTLLPAGCCLCRASRARALSPKCSTPMPGARSWASSAFGCIWSVRTASAA